MEVDGSEILAMPVSESALSDFEVGFLPLPESSRIYHALLSSSRVSLGSTVSLFGAVGMVGCLDEGAPKVRRASSSLFIQYYTAVGERNIRDLSSETGLTREMSDLARDTETI
jgi:hypothetical protein